MMVLHSNVLSFLICCNDNLHLSYLSHFKTQIGLYEKRNAVYCFQISLFVQESSYLFFLDISAQGGKVHEVIK